MIKKIEEAAALVRPTYAEIDLAAIAANLRHVRRLVGSDTGILAVVKSDAYGHGLVAVSRILEAHGISYFGVVRLEEALELRTAGIKSPILMMGGLLPGGFELAARHAITIGIIDWASLEELERQAVKFKTPHPPIQVHIKIDTGMHRLGIPQREYIQHIDIIKKIKNIKVCGLFSHLANADNLNDDYAFEQLAQLEEAYALTKALLPGQKLLRHLANSDGIFRDKRLHLDMVRPGIALYGYGKRTTEPLQPAMQLRSRIVQIQDVPSDATVGYDRFWRATRAARIGVLPIGYADGFSRAYTGSRVMVCSSAASGTKKLFLPATIVGRICMDMLMIDITDHPKVAVGDEVVLLGGEGETQVSAYDLARMSSTTHYQVLTSIQSRVPRFYKDQQNAATPSKRS